jgi:hypothetical protein
LLEKEANERAMPLVAGAIIFSSYISLFLFWGGFPLYSFSSGGSAGCSFFGFPASGLYFLGFCFVILRRRRWDISPYSLLK